MADVRLTATNPEDSSVVPVACNAKGELLLEEPTLASDDYVAVTGDTMTGNLFLNDQITLDATTGTASFAGDVVINGLTVGLGAGSVTTNTVVGNNALSNNTTGSLNTAIGLGALINNTEGNFNTAVGREALARNTTGLENTAVGRNALQNNISGTRNTALGQNAGQYIEGNDNTILGPYIGDAADATLNDTVIISAGTTERMRIDQNGIASFSGDVIVSSRNKLYMLVEQNGLCHMVEQVRATTADLVNPASAVKYPPLRDVFAELDAIEKALEEVMDKLRMAPPAGWEVWDGSSKNS